VYHVVILLTVCSVRSVGDAINVHQRNTISVMDSVVVAIIRPITASPASYQSTIAHNAIVSTTLTQVYAHSAHKYSQDVQSALI
jgi:hypothetical protein